MTKNWFRIGLLAIFIFSFTLRFWGLDRFNTLVFDEVYFAKFGNNYLTNTPFFNAHPPLSQYIIGIGIWIGKHVPFWQQQVNGLAGSLLSPWNYRWVNALTGSFIPVVVAAIAYQISHRRSFALLAGFFTACDGLFLVESRYALNNIYIVIFGLLGQWFLLLALENQKRQRALWLIASGIGFGASIGTKWNGLWFLLGTYLIWVTAWLLRLLHAYLNKQPINKPINKIDTKPLTPLEKLTEINILQMGFYLGIIPALIYSLIWIPHLRLDTSYGFIEVHRQILNFHLHMGGNTPDVHPYCAAWYKWPLMTRPMAYYYQTTRHFSDPLPVMGPNLPAADGMVIYDVHAMGNPFLWWSGMGAMLFLAGWLLSKIVIPLWKNQPLSVPATLSIDTWIAIFIVFNYAANLLPWVKVTRCVFIYHYMCAVVYVFLAIAWFVDQSLRSYHRELRAVGVTVSFLILVGFIFWMPIYLGLPLTSEGYKLRMWFNTWI
ncbi:MULTISPECIES: dolichyl-phosphate-mannose--protein mannosyltransferase [Calothrix]|uniref:Polyprenol-phosphate-mannose--protein mannosyltransferase n=2 Tax=Calothrix TaxID=1186 RepID=A0ABR8A976_9CYAN|nr:MULTISPECIES: phospholipid carrier-dependent glycosyltransferase [Calothrix]MBD2196547.1 phospholipid carrier-dependent glycosyltransferase [Calothrix parietina FACHB-288]MBD2227387.1 phospholipid carrier-dependent glycosyltransferase [Calothrix anomala FACHB-343]